MSISGLSLLVLFCGVVSVHGHGRLIEPASRSSLWRFGKSKAINYNDNQLFCGGFGNQYFRNNGKCGICGDPYQGPRDNEAGGKYALGIIAGHYKQGQVMHTVVEVTVNHYGYFEFKLCPNNDVKKVATQECLDRHLLPTTNGSTRFYVTQNIVGKYKFQLQLPPELTCSQCVLQWRWHGGNNWGHDPVTGQSCKGCGPQEEFYGCADISIGAASGVEPVVQRPEVQKQEVQKPVAQQPGGSGFMLFGQRVTQHRPLLSQVNPQRPVFRPGVDLSRQTTTTRAPQRSVLRCHGINNWAGMVYFDKWCTDQCANGNCPSTACSCS